MAGSRLLMFHDLARYYDLFLEEKDYRSEADRLVTLARQLGPPHGRRWLDVGCGTGRHLEFLRRRYTVVGLDASPSMLRIAHRRLPGVRLVRADMRRFHLRESFDVITCLFGAIGHIGSPREIRAVLRNFAHHLRPGGLVIVEPWIEPAEFRAGMLHRMSQQAPDTIVVRLTYSTRKGRHSVLTSHYLVAERGQGIVHRVETDGSGLLLSRAELSSIMEESGLHPRFVARGLRPGHGLLIGVRKPSGA